MEENINFVASASYYKVKKGFTTACQIKNLFSRFAPSRFSFCTGKVKVESSSENRASSKNLPFGATFCGVLGGWVRFRFVGKANRLPHFNSHTISRLMFAKCTALSSSFAFTLAEVLITLTVIGVVAAIAIPPVARNHRAVSLRSGFEYAFAFVSRSVKKMNFEEGKLPTPDNYPAHTFKPAFMKYVHVLKDCGLGWTDKDNAIKPCVERTLKENPTSPTDTETKAYKTYNKKDYIYSYRMDDGQIILLNGMYVFIENATEPIFITVDINGYVKKPNLWGHDLFTFQLMNDGTVRPMGAPGTMYTDSAVYCSKTSNDTMNGIACAYKAATDPNYFKTLP